MAEKNGITVADEIAKATLDEVLSLVEDQITLKKMAVENGFPNERAVNIWIQSKPGIGKTQRLQQVAADNGCGISVVNCGNLQPGDLSGLATRIENKETGDVELVKMLVDRYFPKPPKNEKEEKDPNHPYNKVGFLFLDELGNADLLVRSELLRYCDGTTRLSDGKFPALPPSWFVVASGNTEESIGRANYIQFGYNVEARFATFEVEPDIEEYKGYMATYHDNTFNCSSFHPSVFAYLDLHNNDLAPDPKYDSKNRIVANPRNWESFSKNIRLYEKKVEGNANIQAAKVNLTLIAKGLLGPDIATAFLTFYEYQKDMIEATKLMAKDISKDPKFKEYEAKDIQIKLLSIYTALDKANNLKGTDEKKMTDAMKKSMYVNIVENTGALFGDREHEHIIGIMEIVLKTLPGKFTSNDFSTRLRHLAEKSSIFQSLGKKG